MSRRRTEFQTIRSEGGLLPSDLLRRILDPKEKIPGTQPEDYGLPHGDRINETVTQSWNRLRRHWTEFKAAAKGLSQGEAATGLTNDKWSVPLLRELGFGLLPTSPGPEISGRVYAINRFSGQTPIHLVGCGLSLDRRAAGVRGAAMNPHGLVQEFLNRSEGHLWAIISNGLRFRILRDNQALSRQAFLEFDLETMFAGEIFSDFVLFWLIAHATRFAVREEGRTESCWLEQWMKLAEEQGTRALGDLRAGVEKALEILGQGFVGHPHNSSLRDALRKGRLSLADFHGQLLRVVYRLIFLFVSEDRNLDGISLLHPRDDSEDGRLARERYTAHYGTARLRELASGIKGSRHGDLWRQFNLLVGALSGEERFSSARQQLALPILGSMLWSPAATAELNAPGLAESGGTELSNADFLEALRSLAFTRQNKILRPVDYKNLGSEELGGVYESLLALTPQISGDGARFTFAEFAGNERKTSGSYYTPDSLVQCLLDSALDPVVEEAIKGKTGAEAEKAVLSLKVCDPAVGSGHFLVGAAHRLARHLARVRAHAQGESEPSPLLFQHALRDVVGHCLYGVDINPMAAELCRVSLWLEAIEPGKPLSFLDHHIRVGNSLLGATPELIANGIPDEAFEPIEGDDKKLCQLFKKRNKVERQGQQSMFYQMVAEPQAEYNTLNDRIYGIDAVDDSSFKGIQEKESRFAAIQRSIEFQHAKLIADAWCSAFVWKKTSEFPYPITEQVFRLIETEPIKCPDWMHVEIGRLASDYRFFHWHLAFPEVFAKDGFDCVLGNPPWVRQELFKPIKNLLTVYESYKSTADISVFFLELSVRILALSGIAALLTPNKWFRAAYGEELRVYIRSCARLYLIIDFGHAKRLFGDADTFPACLILSRAEKRLSDQTTLRFVRAFDEDRARISLDKLVSTFATEVTYANLDKFGWSFNDTNVERILSTMRANSRPLADYVGGLPLYGLKTGLNEAFYLEESAATAVMTEEPQSRELIRPFIRGRDIKRWNIVWAHQWHIVIPSSHNRSWPWSLTRHEQEAEAIFSRAHPLIHSHLKQYEKGLRKRTDKGVFWWELRSCDYYSLFSRRKIAVALISYHSSIGFDDNGYFQNNSSVMIPTEDLFVLAALNSRVGWWYMSLTFPHMKDEALSMEAEYLAKFPIPNIPEAAKESTRESCRMLRQIAANPATSLAERLRFEKQLSDAIWNAYGLGNLDQAILNEVPVPRDPILLLSESLKS